MTNSIRWGILGTGSIADLFARDLVLHGFALQAVGSRTQRTADTFAADFQIPTAHASYEALVEDPDVDIVYIATPHPFHAENAVLALNAGKHVLIEKPFTLNARQAKDVVGLAAEKGLLVLEAMWTRFLPHMKRIVEILEGGALGDVRSLTADITERLSEDPAHRLNSLELGGGALLDLGVYPISFASQLFGTPQSIVANASLGPTGVDTNVATIFRYADGELASTFSSSATRGRNMATILGTKGRIEIESAWSSAAAFRVFDTDNVVTETFESDVSGRGMQFEALEAERLIHARHTASDILSPGESVSIMETLDTIRDQIGLRYPGE